MVQNRSRQAKKYDGKVDTKNIDKRRLKCEFKDDQLTLYSGIVYSISLGKLIKVAFVDYLDKKRISERIDHLFSTNINRQRK